METPSSVFLQGFSPIQVQDEEWVIKAQRGEQTPGSPQIRNVIDATKSDIALRHALGKNSICKTRSRVL